MKKIFVLVIYLTSFNLFSNTYTTIDTFEFSTGLITSSSFTVVVERKEDGFLYSSISKDDSKLNVTTDKFIMLKADLYLLDITWSYSDEKTSFRGGQVPSLQTYTYVKKGKLYIYYSEFAELLYIEGSGDELELQELETEKSIYRDHYQMTPHPFVYGKI